jgi:methyltransferase (TIGR00027 family)
MGRAVAHGGSVARFSDPTALELLPDDARAVVERMRTGAEPSSLSERVRRGYLKRQANVMVARTVAIDDAVRSAKSPQLVILGAGLDGRAWRMPELKDAIVFEVDHPDSQREKRARVGRLTQAAREVRFVPVDFTRDHLDDALAAAGHDATRSTTWIWEGVVMYLTLPEIEATLAVIAKRSAAPSFASVTYHSPAMILRLLVGSVTRSLGEPLRSTFTADAMRALLARYGFEVIRDHSIPEIASALSPELGRQTRMVKHLRIALARR